MPDIPVDIPGVGTIDFPDTMKPEEIDAAAKRLHDEAHPPESLWRKVGRAALDTLPGIGGIVGGVLSSPETFGVGTVPGAALGVGVGRGARDLIGHYTGLDAPSSPVDKAKNIATDTGVAAATGAILPGVVSAVKAPLQTLREGAEQFGAAMPPALRRLGALFPSLPESAPSPTLTRPPWQALEGAPTEPTPRPETTATGTGFQPGAPPPSGPMTWTAERPSGGFLRTASTPAPTASSGLSAADRAALVKQGYSADVIARIEQATGGNSPRQTPMASHAPTTAPTAAPDTPVQPDLQGPRIVTGAERVGRQVGMSKEDVRQAAGPVLDETRGEASPILPQQALGNIIDAIKAMPPGSPEREAYVARATSGKTKWQVENIRRTLEHLGLIVPAAAAAPTVRDELMRLMSSHQSEGS